MLTVEDFNEAMQALWDRDAETSRAHGERLRALSRDYDISTMNPNVLVLVSGRDVPVVSPRLAEYVRSEMEKARR